MLCTLDIRGNTRSGLYPLVFILHKNKCTSFFPCCSGSCILSELLGLAARKIVKEMRFAFFFSASSFCFLALLLEPLPHPDPVKTTSQKRF